MTNQPCEHCGNDLVLTARQRARFSDTRCRSHAFRAQKTALPIELTTRDRWVRRTAEKVPLTVAAMAASSTDPRTWSDYESARKSTHGVGTGFVLSDVDDVAVSTWTTA
ncbi:hypothetical protein [Streptomyces niveus]|uniref:hypothetical protein n=1 Tax=Streptomyces niveus TaxID=193462 RepID=UPI00364F7782